MIIKDSIHSAGNQEKTREPESEKLMRKLTEKERRLRELQRLGFYFLLLVIIFWILLSFVVGVTTAKTADMEPKVNYGDLLLYFRLEKDIRAGDILVVEKGGTEYVGRVVAKGGDTVNITENSTLFVNGNPSYEEDIFFTTPPYEGFVKYPLTLKNDEYFILGDHREGAEDSRYFGAVKKDEIKGVLISLARRNNM